MIQYRVVVGSENSRIFSDACNDFSDAWNDFSITIDIDMIIRYLNWLINQKIIKQSTSMIQYDDVIIWSGNSRTIFSDTWKVFSDAWFILSDAWNDFSEAWKDFSGTW